MNAGYGWRRLRKALRLDDVVRGARFDEKARENMEAAERLLPDESGEREALANASAARAYYGAYLAVADRAQQIGHTMTSKDGTWYRHDTLPREARAWGVIGEDDAEILSWLYALRIKADYREDQVSLEEASVAFGEARRIVTAMLAGGTKR